MASNRFAAHSFRPGARACAAGLAQRGFRGTAGKTLANERLRGMADEKEHGHDRRLAAPRPPAMKLSVRSRASASVNCSGGDFMK